MANRHNIYVWFILGTVISYGPACCLCERPHTSAYTVEEMCHSDREPRTVKGCTVKVDSARSSSAVFKPTLACARHCSSDNICIGYSFYPGQRDCFLHYNCGNPLGCDASNLRDVVFYRRKATRSDCDRARGVWKSESESCKCPAGVVGRRCERPPESCGELALWGHSYKYQTRTKIKPPGFQDKITVACKLLTKYSTAFTFFMRNVISKDGVYGRLSDTHKWENCVKGVDTKDDYVNFWSGLENIRYLSTASNSGTLTLAIDSAQRYSLYLDYHDVKIGDASTNYALSYGKFGRPRGNLPFTDSEENCLHVPQQKSSGKDPTQSPGIPFSAPDADNDLDEDRNCAKLADRGWWFVECSKHLVCNMMGDLSYPLGGQAVWYPGRPASLSIVATKAFFTHNYTDTLPGL